MNGVTEFVRTLGPARLAAMGAVAAGLVGFLIFLMLRFSQPQLGVLYTDLTFNDSLQIVKKLESMNIPHEIRQDGSIILAPKDKVLRLRMEMADSGLPAGGTVGYEIFDKADTLGATSFVQNINRVRAIEGELARTIRVLRRIIMARVHLVLPKRELFGRKSREPSASIVVKTRGELDPGQIKAIQHLAASAVDGLKPSRVSIVNESGVLLASGREDGPLSGGTEFGERNRAVERRMRREIEDIVASIVGSGRVRVRVSTEMDYSKVTKTTDVYDPDGQVVRSTQSRQESANATTPNGNDGVSVGNELPAANAEPGSDGSQQENSNKSEEVVNYEISRTTMTETAEGGRVKRLSVAVLVDGIYQKDAQGTVTYSPRPEEQLDQIRTLVRSAIGFVKDRGDQVQVVNLRFAETQAPAVADGGEQGWLDSFMSMSKDDYFTIAELTVVGLISLLVLLLVVRPLVRRIITPEQNAPALEVLTAGDTPLLAGPDGQPLSGDNLALPAPSSPMAETLKSARVAGDIQAKAVDDVGETIKSNPDEAVTIVRDWIQQTA
ncbi:MAG TPA: flagellar M-ring protein FliF [Rhizobiales bacterium]|nr:flagellar M-ring protein [bacterium BMS3Bbin10]HDO52482.1 flagellar M-ring protein FliF [Hyphomicrobiales bacterium]